MLPASGWRLTASLFDAALIWKDIGRLARVTKLPFLVKGVAVGHGVSGIILLPEISAHPARREPDLLEYVDWADAILESRCRSQDDLARVPDRPGIGLTWRSEAVKALSLDR